MQLTEIKEDVCPHCGAEAEEETRKNKHTNGHWNESRKFSCGLMLEFSPNFRRTTESSYNKCPSSADEKKRRENIDAAKQKVMEFAEQLDIDDKFKMALVDAVKWK